MSWRGLAVLLATGGGLAFYFRQRREERKQLSAQRHEQRSVGRPAIGGPFTLTSSDGTRVSKDDFLGKWVLLYFGFTFCPDICPEELEKMAEVLNKLGGASFISLHVPVLPPPPFSRDFACSFCFCACTLVSVLRELDQLRCSDSTIEHDLTRYYVLTRRRGGKVSQGATGVYQH